MASVKVSESASGDRNIVAAPAAGERIRVLGYALVAAGAVGVYWTDGTTQQTGAMPLAANGGVVAGVDGAGWFDCGAGLPLKLNLSAAVQVSGHVRYEVVSA
jgi:hypothetical protein